MASALTSSTPTLPLTVANGGTGDATLTAYAPLFGGTTTTGAIQSGTVGTSGQVLTSNGAGALATFQTAAGGGIGGSTGATADRVLTSSGTGGATLQATPVTITTTGLLSGQLYKVNQLDTGTVLTATESGKLLGLAVGDGNATLTLPAAPAIGTFYDFAILSTEQLTIQAQGSHKIRIGASVSSAAGTAISSTQGSRVNLVYAASNQWIGLASGTWALA